MIWRGRVAELFDGIGFASKSKLVYTLMRQTDWLTSGLFALKEARRQSAAGPVCHVSV